jgi:hypothetical protein
MRVRVIQIHSEAPPKPQEGQPCNGCGICCLADPCPVGILVSGRWHGACRAVQWSDNGGRYVCGMLLAPLPILGWRGEGAASRWVGRLISRLCARWIAAGVGCDSSLQASSGQTSSHPGETPG